MEWRRLFAFLWTIALHQTAPNTHQMSFFICFPLQSVSRPAYLDVHADTQTHTQTTRKDVRGPFTAIFSSRNISPAPKCVRAVYLFMLTWKSIIHNLPYQPPERRVIRMCARVCVCVKRFSFLHPPSPFPFSSASLENAEGQKVEGKAAPASPRCCSPVRLGDWDDIFGSVWWPRVCPYAALRNPFPFTPIIYGYLFSSFFISISCPVRLFCPVPPVLGALSRYRV